MATAMRKDGQIAPNLRVVEGSGPSARRVRVHELAKELGLTSKELMAYLEGSGRPVKSHLATLEHERAEELRKEFALATSVEEAPVVDERVVVADGETVPARQEIVAELREVIALDEPEASATVTPITFKLTSAPREKVEQPAPAPKPERVKRTFEEPNLFHSLFATFSVAVVPIFVSFGIFVWGQPNPRPVIAAILAIVLTASSIHFGNELWKLQPESEGYPFGDLMLWSWACRHLAEQRLVRDTDLLGFARNGEFLRDADVSSADKLKLMRSIGEALDSKSFYTRRHSFRVEKHARQVAEVLELNEKETEELALAAAIHDIGNLSVPESLLRKNDELTSEERTAVQGHALFGAIMAVNAGSTDVIEAVRHHHEHWDGNGYPAGLAGEEIPLFGRIIAIAEAYDAMTSTRAYRQSLSPQQAIEVLRAQAGRQFDPELVEAFIATLPEPMAVIERFPVLAGIQRQIREISLFFKRMGGVAISATASTIAIALILGGSFLAQDEPRRNETVAKNRVRPPEQKVSAAPMRPGTHNAPERWIRDELHSLVGDTSLVADEQTMKAVVLGDKVKNDTGKIIVDLGSKKGSQEGAGQAEPGSQPGGSGNQPGGSGNQPGGSGNQPGNGSNPGSGPGSQPGEGSGEPPQIGNSSPSGNATGQSNTHANPNRGSKAAGDAGRAAGEAHRPADAGEAKRPADAGRPSDSGSQASTQRPDSTGSSGSTSSGSGSTSSGSSAAPSSSDSGPGRADSSASTNASDKAYSADRSDSAGTQAPARGR